MIEQLLSRLDKVSGRNGSWVACCPAHEDRRPSMSIREQDGKILLHCFAGCEVADIVGAIGMDLTDLFPPRETHMTYDKPAAKVRLYASDVLKVLHLEAQLVMVAAYNMANGTSLDDADRERLKLAWQRIDTGMRRVEGQP